MKVAISLPDTLFAAAEHLAQQLRISRSQLYARALADFMEKRDDASITESLNRVYGATHKTIDADVNKAQSGVLAAETW